MIGLYISMLQCQIPMSTDATGDVTA